MVCLGMYKLVFDTHLKKLPLFISDPSQTALHVTEASQKCRGFAGTVVQ